MSYNYSKGDRKFGDITSEDDANGDTKIDFEEDYIAFRTAGSDVLVVSGSSVGIGTTTPDNLLTVVGGHISSDGGIKTGTAHFSWSQRTPTFVADTEDLVSYISFGNNSVWGWVEVTITDDHIGARVTGKYTKRYQIGRNPSTAINHQLSEVPANIGAIVDHFKIGDFEVDNNDLRIPIYRVSTKQNQVQVLVEGQLHVASLDTADNVLDSLSLSTPAVVANSETRDYYSIMSDRVGIGTTSPGYELEVSGNIGVNEYIYHNGDSDTFIRLEDDEINIEAGGQPMIKMVEAGTDIITINNGGNDIDFQIKSLNNDNLIRTDAANDRVGIGTSAPGSTLQTSGSVGFNVTVFTANDTLDETHHVAVADCNAAAVTLTLPAATSAMTGRQYIIKRADSSNSNAQAFVIAPGSGDDIDGADSDITDIDDGTSHTLICIGTSGWILVDKYVGI